MSRGDQECYSGVRITRDVVTEDDSAPERRCRRLAMRHQRLWDHHIDPDEARFRTDADYDDYYDTVHADTILCDFLGGFVYWNDGVVISDPISPPRPGSWGTHVEENLGVFIGSKYDDDVEMTWGAWHIDTWLGREGSHDGVFYGRGGDDLVDDGAGVFVGGRGNDRTGGQSGSFRGGPGNDSVEENYPIAERDSVGVFIGGPGDDHVDLQAGRFLGGPGADSVHKNTKDGAVAGGPGNDTVDYNDGFFHGGPGTDTVSVLNTGICRSVEVGCTP